MTDLQTAVRMETGDSDPKHGIFPGRTQATEAQFAYAAEQEGVTELDSPTPQQIGRVSAKLLEMASTAWAAQPVESEVGPQSEVNTASATLSQKAAALRLTWGYGGLESPEAGRNTRIATYSGNGAYVLPPGVN